MTDTNQLRVIPTELGQLTSLAVLDLSKID